MADSAGSLIRMIVELQVTVEKMQCKLDTFERRLNGLSTASESLPKKAGGTK